MRLYLRALLSFFVWQSLSAQKPNYEYGGAETIRWTPTYADQKLKGLPDKECHDLSHACFNNGWGSFRFKGVAAILKKKPEKKYCDTYVGYFSNCLTRQCGHHPEIRDEYQRVADAYTKAGCEESCPHKKVLYCQRWWMDMVYWTSNAGWSTIDWCKMYKKMIWCGETSKQCGARYHMFNLAEVSGEYESGGCDCLLCQEQFNKTFTKNKPLADKCAAIKEYLHCAPSYCETRKTFKMTLNEGGKLVNKTVQNPYKTTHKRVLDAKIDEGCVSGLAESVIGVAGAPAYAPSVMILLAAFSVLHAVVRC